MTTIERVHVVFKTHLDIGFTHLAARVTEQYRQEYIPKAIALAERLDDEGGSAGFVWTTGSWLIQHYMDTAGDEERRRMENAIARGHIAWHGLPCTTHTELMDEELFRFGLSIGRDLDARYGKETIAAKMTDVPGHTLGIVPLMAKAGLRYLHLGVNPASKRPDVPRLFRWQAEDGSELIVNYAGTYGEDLSLEGLRDVLVFAHTGDNCGPPSVEEIREQFAQISKRYPGAEVIASTMDAFARKLLEARNELPVVREELGDTWIHGAGTDPLKLARFRELQRLRDGWLAEGKLKRTDEAYRRMSMDMLMVAEHTWGLDVKKWLPDFRNYAKRDFQAARLKDEVDANDIPAKFGYIGAFAMNEFDKHSAHLFSQEESRRSYSRIESSWAEQRRYVDLAVSHLDASLRDEAERAFEELKPKPGGSSGAELSPAASINAGYGWQAQFDGSGALVLLSDACGKSWADEAHPFGAYVYETFGTEDYARYFRTYMQNLPVTHPWADADFSKPGFEFVRPLPSHRLYAPSLTDLERLDDGRYRLRLAMPAEAHEEYGAPSELEIVYAFGSEMIDVSLQWFGKEANRLPEASWFKCALNVDNPNLWKMDKLGQRFSPLNVVKGGNRNLHGVGQGVHYEGADGTACIETLDAALAAPGGGRLLQFDQSFAPLDRGWHFNLHNNIWGTNFPMWYGEDAKFRFRLRLRSNPQ
ncbi:DUF5054 domain-containing protein [Cohnella terricola]|uniref:DUF5054 domain-containing protein n=1 Tax=Cohnella terricola TaxID=1289167 RepID=A0A559J9A2_9BACL|nr:DUF5054 domain-containing protein [Cohnella terricola]TVX96478.1 DUF5054 domain-containing protein [Cohnella terricola]